jgi:translocation and assembly module TamB
LTGRAVAPARRWLRRTLAAFAGLTCLLLIARLGLNTDVARGLISQQINGAVFTGGLRITVEGLTGDPLRDPRAARLTLSDASGVFATAQDAELRWRPLTLLNGVLRLDRVSARRVDLLRRPHLPTRDTGLSLDLDLRAAEFPQIALAPGVIGQIVAGQIVAGQIVAGQIVAGQGVAGQGVAGQGGAGQGGAGQGAVFSVRGDFARGRNAAFDLNARIARIDAAGDHGELHARRSAAGRFQLTAAARGAPGGVLATLAEAPPGAELRLKTNADGDATAGVASLTLTIGASTVVDAAAQWSRARLTGRGVVTVGAAPALRAWSARLGGPVTLRVDAPRNGRSAGEALAVAPNITLRLGGVLPATALAAPDRMTITAETRRLSALAPEAAVAADTVRLAGRVTRTRRGWGFAGMLEAHSIATPQARMGRLAGPVRAEPLGTGWRVSAQLGAEDAAIGPPALATTIGARPALDLEAEIAPAGRSATLKSLTIRGSHGKARTQGAIDFATGAVALASHITITQPPGAAAGSLTADLELARRDHAEPLLVSLTGAGRGVDAGAAWRDLIGPAPKFAATGRLDQGVLALERASLDGQNLRAGLAGRASLRRLDLRLEAALRGPFRIGPYEATGEVDAFGSITGAPAAARLRLEARVDQLHAGPATLQDIRLSLAEAMLSPTPSAAGRLTARTPRGPLEARAALSFEDGRLRLRDITATWAGLAMGGAIALDGVRPIEAQLSASGPAAQLLGAGGGAGRQGAVDAVLELFARDDRQGVRLRATGRNLGDADSRLVARRVALSLDGALEALTLEAHADGLAAETPFALTLSGSVRQSGAERAAAVDVAGAYAGVRFSSLGPVRFSARGGISEARGAIGASGGTLTFAAAAGPAERLNATIELDDAPAALARVVWPDAPLQGALSGRASLDGTGRLLTGSLALAGRGLAPLGDPGAGADLRIDARLTQGRVRVLATAAGAPDFSGRLEAELPMIVSTRPFVLQPDLQAPAKAAFSLGGEAGGLWRFIGAPHQRVRGRLAVQGALAGALARPELTGAATLSAGDFEDERLGLRLSDITARGVFSGRQLSLQSLTATDGGGGQVTAAGVVAAGPRGVDWDITALLARFSVLETPDFAARGSGRIQYQRRPGEAGVVSGALTLDEATLSLPEAPQRQGVAIAVTHKNRPAEPAAPARFGADPPTRLDLALDAPGRVLTRGRGLDAEWSLTGRLGGVTTAPLLTGEARLVRGGYDIAGRRFDLREGRITFAGALDRPLLDLTAVREQGDYAVAITVSGDARRPTLAVRSTPALPQDEALARALFARSAAELSPPDAAELAAGLATLAGSDRFSVARALGLDRFNLTQTARGTVMTGGRRLTPDVYVELSGGARGWSGAQIEWMPRPHLSLVSRFGGEGDARIAVRWRRDY